MRGQSPKRGTLAVLGLALAGILLVLAGPALSAAPGLDGFRLGRAQPEPVTKNGTIEELCEKRVVNVDGDGFTVVWASSMPTTAFVRYGTSPATLASTACDVRDPAAPPDCAAVFETHFVVVSGLLPETTYYVQAVTAGSDDGPVIEVATGPEIAVSPGELTFGPIFDNAIDFNIQSDVYVCGTLIDADGSESSGSSSVRCTVVLPTDGGFWTLSLGNFRTQDLTSVFEFSPTSDQVLHEACGASRGCDEHQLSTADDSPAPDLYLDDGICLVCDPTGLPETSCDGVDDDCDGQVDEDADSDGDGFISCDNLDCDDADPAINPGAQEILCDTIDNDCDPETSDDTNLDDDPVTFCDGDCNDENGNVYPGNEEEACDGLDNDCDDLTEDDPNADGDPVSSCEGDCDDDNAAVYPGNTETQCDELDNDCDASTADDVNLDGDAVSFCDGDCDDDDAGVFPGNSEMPCDGLDNDCDPATLDELDLEINCNGLDDDCDGATPDDLNDDNDPVSLCDGDCDDLNAGIYPGNTEQICDGIDNDCDGATADDPNLDGDPVTFCDDDCDDTNALAYPGNSEVCDDVDNDCDGLVDEEFDADLDTVADCFDNCPGVPNPNQTDFDQDGMGDICEIGPALADIDQSNHIDGFDLAQLARAFGTACGELAYDRRSDLDHDCFVDGADLALLAIHFGMGVP